jgi:hypothetical protein
MEEPTAVGSVEGLLGRSIILDISEMVLVRFSFSFSFLFFFFPLSCCYPNRDIIQNHKGPFSFLSPQSERTALYSYCLFCCLFLLLGVSFLMRRGYIYWRGGRYKEAVNRNLLHWLFQPAMEGKVYWRGF